jgi:predicted metal-dependent hydrolase
MATKLITLPEIGEITLYKRKGHRSIRISVTGAKVRVTQPTWLPFSAGESFAHSRIEWMKDHLKTDTLYVDGQQIGISHTLKLAKGVGLSRRVTASTLLITYPKDIESSHASVQKYIESSVVKVLRKQAESYLPIRTSQLAELFNFTFTSVGVKLLKRRWGSCNSKKEIIFNLKLMELDTLHIDYVILHELTHTIHMNHGEQFWVHMESVMPGSKKIAKAVRHLNL